MYKFFLLSILLSFSVGTFAQSLVINGNIVINDNSPADSRLTVSRNGEVIEEKTLDRKGRFDLKLAFGADYRIGFEKAGYVTKIVNINTEVPEEVMESNPNFPPVKLIINLMPTVDEVDLSVFKQPIAILAYNAEVDDFTFDKEYSEKIKVRIAQAEQAIKKALTQRNSAAIELDRKFAELVQKGQQEFDKKVWSGAIDHWTQALSLKPEDEATKQKIATAHKEMELTAAQAAVEQQNKRAYDLLIGRADSLFSQQRYMDAKEKYASAVQLNGKAPYPAERIREIDSILADLAKQKVNEQKQLAAREADYRNVITTADQHFTAKEYEQAIVVYQRALEMKPAEKYPQERIRSAEEAIAKQNKLLAAEEERKRIEQERKDELRNKYAQLIAEADVAFRNENYAMARMKYTEANRLDLGEEYPRKQLEEIDSIINSARYKAKLTEYNTNKTLAEKNLAEKNYASAKVYYQKALSVLSIDKEMIDVQIEEIDRQIEAAHLESIAKEYRENIAKADKAFHEKAYAVARFYYKKAVDIKPMDKYALDRLKEITSFIGNRQEKETEL